MQIYSDKLFLKPIKIIEAFNNEGFKKAFELIEKHKKNHYLLGYIRYEAKDIFLGKLIESKLPLLYFEVFENYQKYESQPIKESIFLNAVPNISYKKYAKNIQKIKNYIASGETYQVNYTYDCNLDYQGSAIDLYEYILAKQKTPYNAFIQNKYEKILSFSPELFFTLENNIIKTKPMKGTIQRGSTDKKDKENIEFLKNDIKNRAENIMIVDLLRNDLGKIAKTGSVNVPKLFEIETHPTVHQMTSEVEAKLNENTTLYDIFEAIFPCGSITGAPKINTMKVIEELENKPRHIYCGAIGFISPEKSVFSVPIRILQKQNRSKYYKYYVGGAIVWDSTEEDEWQETLTKTKVVSSKKDFKLVETIKVEEHKLVLGDLHFKRLKNSAKKLGFKFNNDLLKIKPEKNGILRILLSENGNFELESLPCNDSKTDKVILAKSPVNSKEILLRHKTTYKPWYEKSYEKIKNDEIYDEIFYNEKNELTESARTNIVLKIQGKMFTSKLKSGLLNGILREKMLKEGSIQEKILYIEDLKKADEIYCINSVRGMKKVVLSDSD